MVGGAPNTGGTLRTLTLEARTKFRPDALLALLPLVGPSLHHLHVDLVPWSPCSQLAAGRPGDTEQLRAAVQTHCTALLTPAHVVCHRDRAPH